MIVPVAPRGGSLYLLLNKEILKKYDVKEGDYLNITLEEDGFKCQKIKDVIT